MQNVTRHLITEVVAARAEESAEHGVPLNAEMRRRETRELKRRVIAGEVSDEDMREHLRQRR